MPDTSLSAAHEAAVRIRIALAVLLAHESDDDFVSIWILQCTKPKSLAAIALSLQSNSLHKFSANESRKWTSTHSDC
jgi:hypothetical protein